MEPAASLGHALLCLSLDDGDDRRRAAEDDALTVLRRNMFGKGLSKREMDAITAHASAFVGSALALARATSAAWAYDNQEFTSTLAAPNLYAVTVSVRVSRRSTRP